MSAMRKVYDALDKGEGITLFPEGTRNKNGEELQAVKSGAALFALHGKCDVVPIIILHKQRAFRRNYLYVAPAFSLNEYAIGGRVNGAARRFGFRAHRKRDAEGESILGGLRFQQALERGKESEKRAQATVKAI